MRRDRAATAPRPRRDHAAVRRLKVHRDDTVDELKRRIRDERGVPVDDQTLSARMPMTPTFTPMEPGGSTWRVPGEGCGTIADYEVNAGEQLRLETSRTAPPLPTCTKCRVCVDACCELESGPKDPPEWATRAARVEAPRNGPCPCGSGKKAKKCCARA